MQSARTTGALLALALALLPARGWADTEVSGTLVIDTVFSAAGSPYRVTGTLTVAEGAVLSVRPGVTLAFAAGAGLVVRGRLLAVGAADAPVVLLSVGELDGGQPAPGDWGPLRIEADAAGGASRLRHVVVRHGQGLVLLAASPLLEHVALRDNAGAAIAIDLASSPRGSGISATGNGLDGVRVPAGEISGERRWGLVGLPYFVEGRVDVGAAPRLDRVVDPGLAPGEHRTPLVLEGQRLGGAEWILFDDPDFAGEVLDSGATWVWVDVEVDFFALDPGERPFTLQVAAGELGGSVSLVTPTPELVVLAPDAPLSGPAARTVDVTGAGFLPATVFHLDGEAVETTILSPTEGQLVVPATSMSSAGTLGVTAQTPDPVLGVRVSNALNLQVIFPQLAVDPPELWLLPGDARDVVVRMTPAAEASPYAVTLSLTDPAGSLSAPASVSVPAGGDEAPVTLTALLSAPDAPATLTASGPYALDGAAQVVVDALPLVSCQPAPLLVQPGFEEQLDVVLDRPAPTDGLLLSLRVDDPTGASLAADEALVAGRGTATAATVRGLRRGSYTLAAESGYGSHGSCAIAVVQARAFTEPATVAAYTTNNHVTVRVTTDGVSSTVGLRIEVPPTWSLPELSAGDVSARLASGTDVSANLSQGATGAGTNGGTVFTLAPLALSPAGADPWVDVVFTGLRAPEITGPSMWYVDVDGGAGYATLDPSPVIEITGTVADGAGTVELSTAPSPVSAGTSDVMVTLAFANDLFLETSPDEIYSNWTNYGTATWGLADHGTYGRILRTPDNSSLPSYFVSDDVLHDGTIELEIGALTTGDDDFIGLVFRWQDQGNYYLLDWKQGQQNHRGTGYEGLTLRAIRNFDFDANGTSDALSVSEWLWNTSPSRSDVLAYRHGSAEGWADNAMYRLKVVLSGDHIQVYKNDTLIFDVTDASFASGRYGPYTYSQEQTSIRNLSVSRQTATIDRIELEIPPGWPLPLAGTNLAALRDGDDVTALLTVAPAWTGPHGGTLVLVQPADLRPGRTLDLLFGPVTAPATPATQTWWARTAGSDGELHEIALQPTLEVVP